MLIKQLSIFVENRPGRLSAITQLLAENDVNIKALSIADTRDFGILRLIVGNPTKAMEALKNENCTVSLTSVVGITVDDKPGTLANAVQILYQNNISVEYMYAYNGKKEDKAFVILRVDNNDRAIEAFQEAGIQILTAEEVAD